MICREAVREIFKNKDGVLKTQEVIFKIRERFPEENWKDNTISAHLIALSVNHSSAKHHYSTNKHAFLFSLGNGKYRLHDPEKDGEWVMTDDGPRLKDEAEDTEEETIEEDFIEASISFERDLEEFLVNNLNSIEPGLKLYEEDGITGRQYKTSDVGRIDLLAIDKDNNYVVVELKMGFVNEKVCGQILRYMGWIKENLAKGDANVRGIIIGRNFKEKVKYAVLAAPNIELKRYKVEFNFYNVGLIKEGNLKKGVTS